MKLIQSLSADLLTIELSDGKTMEEALRFCGNIMLEVRDVMGNVIDQFDNLLPDGHISLDATRLSTGIYSYSITNRAMKYSRLMMIVR